MKTNLILLLIIVVISCFNKSNAQNVKTRSISSGLSDPEQKGIVSVVWPQKAESVISTSAYRRTGKSITVGGDNADIRGYTSQAIQAAVDAVHQRGGGIVKILPGNYAISAPVKLYSNIALVGSGPSTVLKKIKGVRANMAIDAGYGELQITLDDASGFNPGMGIQVYDSKRRWGWDVTTAVITSVKGNTIYFDNYLIRDYVADEEGTVSNGISLISAVEADNVRIADLTVDGNREENDALNGCRGGAVYLHKISNAVIENIVVKNYAYDGISWQITENVTVRNCKVFGCSNAGMHPGSGSPGTTIEGNYCHDSTGQ